MEKTTPYSVLIVCEDIKSSAYYLDGKRIALGIPNSETLAMYAKRNVVVDVTGLGKAPVTMAKYAIKQCENSFMQWQSGALQYFVNEAYCVMDVDDHTSLLDAIGLIETFNRSTITGSRITPIISNECFEVWYLLHFMEYSTREIYRNSKTKNWRTKMYIHKKQNIDLLLGNFIGEDYNKSEKNVYNLIKEKGGNESEAITKAKRLLNHHLEVSVFDKIPPNPSSQVYLLIERLNELCINMAT